MSFYNPSARTTQETAFIVKEVCLLLRHPVIYVLLFRVFAYAGMYFVSRCLAINIQVTAHVVNIVMGKVKMLTSVRSGRERN
jgi:hypothetical protein